MLVTVPFAVKALWFALCLTGTITAWIVLYAFGKTVRCMWGPMYYCVAVTLLEGIFCLGMIYKMDPSLMPDSFCFAQMAIITFSAFCLTGICVALTIATTSSVLWAERVEASQTSTLQWRPYYIVPLGVFPVAGTILEVLLVHKFDAFARRSDALICDVTDPEWVRLLGYAGMPLFVSIPCFLMTIAAAFRIRAMNKRHVSSSQKDSTRFSSMPRFAPTSSGFYHVPKSNAGFEMLTTSTQASPISPPASPILTHSPLKTRESTIPSFDPPGLEEKHFSTTPSSTHSMHYDPTSPTSPSFPTFVKPPYHPVSRALFEDERMGVHGESDSDIVSSINFKRETMTSQKTHGDIRAEEHSFDLSQLPNTHIERFSKQSKTTATTTSVLTPAIWRLALFQFAFFAIQVLLLMTTLIDIVEKRPTPSPFGTQYIALLGAAWGPAVVFSHLPGVRRQLMFWK